MSLNQGKRMNRQAEGKLAFISNSEKMINWDLSDTRKKQFVDIQRF